MASLQTFSVGNLRLNTNTLSGSNGRLFYNNSGLLFIGEGGGGVSQATGAVGTGFKVIGGSGLVNSGSITTMDGTQIVLNIAAVSGLTVGDDTLGAKYDTTSINLNSNGALQVFQIAPSNITGLISNSQLQNNSITVSAGSGLANGGSVSLGGSVTLNISARSGVSISGSSVVANYDNSTITLDANERIRVSKVPNALTNGLGIDTLSFDGSSATTVRVDSSQLLMLTGAQTIAGNKTFSNDVRVAGNLTVDGSVVTVNSETVTIADNIILLNSNVTGNVSPTENAGIEVARGNQTYADLIWNETSGKWQAGVSGATYNILTENRLQSTRTTLSQNDISKTIWYNPVTTSLSGKFVAVPTLVSTGVNPDLIGCMVSGFATSNSATFYFSAPIPDNTYFLDAIIMGY